MTHLPTLLASLITLSTLGCVTAAGTDGRANTDDSVQTSYDRKSPEGRGLKFAMDRCSDCHAVQAGMISPNASAPEFSAIANTEGLTEASLASWLATSHDFPEEMYFAIPAEKIDDLVAYVITLKDDTYEPITR